MAPSIITLFRATIYGYTGFLKQVIEYCGNARQGKKENAQKSVDESRANFRLFVLHFIDEGDKLELGEKESKTFTDTFSISRLKDNHSINVLFATRISFMR